MKRGSELGDIDIELHKKESEPKQIKVMLLGRLENPEIKCMRELFHEGSESKMIPLCVKKNQAQQKFRIPFKNMSLSQDADIEFTFVKTPKGSSSDGQEDEIDLQKYLEFYCQPSALKVAAN